jgi:hypothetical protein
MELETVVGVFTFRDLSLGGLSVIESPFGIYHIAFDVRGGQIYGQIWLGQFPTPDRGWYETSPIPGSKVLVAEMPWNDDWPALYGLVQKDYYERMTLAIVKITAVNLEPK